MSGNLGLLGFFKYANFFIDSATTALTALGFAAHAPTLNIVLPVGISFYTFQTMSYSIDVYRRQIKPTRDFLQFLTFVTFFPQLVAGPIERAGHLLGQFANERQFDLATAKDGLRQILWGFMKKLVVADVIAGYTMELDPSMDYKGEFVVVKTIVFAFQIYYDFSAYSDIAIGTAKLFGIRLMRNFANPYFSRNFTEFWERWHISLSTWFRDYVYIPLGGNRLGEGRRKLNLILTFAVSGLWHGANWTFVVWGLLHAYFVLGFGRERGAARESFPATARDLPRIFVVFTLTCFAWIFFWSPSFEGCRRQSFPHVCGRRSDRDHRTACSLPDLHRSVRHGGMVFANETTSARDRIAPRVGALVDLCSVPVGDFHHWKLGCSRRLHLLPILTPPGCFS
jgi:alginate O-acetyltransferase complex protein AlgI